MKEFSDRHFFKNIWQVFYWRHDCKPDFALNGYAASRIETSSELPLNKRYLHQVIIDKRMGYSFLHIADAQL